MNILMNILLLPTTLDVAASGWIRTNDVYNEETDYESGAFDHLATDADGTSKSPRKKVIFFIIKLPTRGVIFRFFLFLKSRV